MIMYLLVIFLLLNVVEINSLVSRMNIKRFRTGLKELKATEAKSTSESIAPSLYADDLYGVLDVPKNSTQREIKDAYWKLAVQYHPDRDDSEEALQIFRNASYAYQVLGKDPKTRSIYDNKGNTVSFLEAIEEVGVDIVVPLARDVALPLLNLTVQSIGAVAVPLFKDAFETSNAVFKAVTDDDTSTTSTTSNKNNGNNNKNNNGNNGNGEELSGFAKIAARAAKALDETSKQQVIRRSNEKTDRVNNALENVRNDLIVAKETEESTRNSLPELEKMINEAKSVSEQVNLLVNEAQSDYEDIVQSSQQLQNNYDTKIKDISALNQVLFTVAESLQTGISEEKKLEEMLEAARLRRIIMESESAELVKKIDYYQQEIDVMNGDIKARDFLKTSAEDTLQQRLSNRERLASESKQLIEELTSKTDELQRNINYREILEKKENSLNQKRLQLEEYDD